MAVVLGVKRIQRAEDAGDEGRPQIRGQPPRHVEERKTARRKRREEQQVGHEERIGARRDERRRGESFEQRRVGIGQRLRRGIKDVGVEQVARVVRELVRDHREPPRREHRVPWIRHAARMHEVRRQPQQRREHDGDRIELQLGRRRFRLGEARAFGREAEGDGGIAQRGQRRHATREQDAQHDESGAIQHRPPRRHQQQPRMKRANQRPAAKGFDERRAGQDDRGQVQKSDRDHRDPESS